jgi:hypothetical protein
VAYEGDTFVLEAVVVGAPQPDVVWLKDKEQLAVMSGRHAAMFDRITGRCSLMVHAAQAGDVGVYSCRATSAAGRAISTANAVVVPAGSEVTITEKARSVKKETVRMVGQQETHLLEISPAFARSLPPVTEVNLGETLILEADFEAEPPPRSPGISTGESCARTRTCG